ncbi:MAG: hypothetical protein H5U17_08805 [Defluviimonas sp.]|nr:hypothetical protein [Defluviimonas sp.]
MTAPTSVRLLLIAEAANPEWVSVPLVGWSMARALAARHKAHIVTQLRNREAFLRAGLIEGQEFTALDTEAIDGRVWRLAKALRLGEKGAWQALTALSSLTYRYFEHQVWRRFGPQIEAGAFDIVHRITPLTPTAVSTLAPRCRRAGAGFVLGPLNGGVAWPKGFGGAQRREREFLMPLRQVYKLQPGYRAMLSASDLVLCGSRDTQADIPAAYQGKTRLMPENGIDPARFPEPPPCVPSQVLRACFVGRLVPYKGCDMLLEAALPYLSAGQMVLDIGHRTRGAAAARLCGGAGAGGGGALSRLGGSSQGARDLCGRRPVHLPLDPRIRRRRGAGGDGLPLRADGGRSCRAIRTGGCLGGLQAAGQRRTRRADRRAAGADRRGAGRSRAARAAGRDRVSPGAGTLYLAGPRPRQSPGSMPKRCHACSDRQARRPRTVRRAGHGGIRLPESSRPRVQVRARSRRACVIRPGRIAKHSP